MTAHTKRAVLNIPAGIARAMTVLILIVLAGAIDLQSKEITDMFGKKAVIPDRIQSAFATSPPATYMLYAIDPAVLAGLNTTVRKWEKKYLHERMRELPVLGGCYGQGHMPNFEMVLKVDPQIIVVPSLNSAVDTRTNRALARIPIPVVSVTMDKLSSYPGAFTYLGEILGRQARAKKLSEYARKTTGYIQGIAGTIPDSRRVSVYYAEAEDGLSTECHLSIHSELIEAVGGRNVHRCRSKTAYGMEKISMEQVLIYNPDVILVFEKTFFKNIFSDPRWQRIKAVKNKKVYLVPDRPFNWFDRPPSFMRLLGAKWLANLLYPDLYPMNIVAETRQFFSLFLGVELTAEEAGKLLHLR